jgi:hypothetical protein
MSVQVQTIATPEATITVTYGDRTDPAHRADDAPYIYREGAATVVLIGGVEVVYDPEHIEQP